jgi:hypothetical protein
MDSGRLKALFSLSWFVAVGLWSAIVPTNAQVNVTEYHNSSKRDGLYIDSALTQPAAANLPREMNSDGTIVDNVYAQPLYIEGGPSGPIVIAVTESNNVSALNASPSSYQQRVSPSEILTTTARNRFPKMFGATSFTTTCDMHPTRCGNRVPELPLRT